MKVTVQTLDPCKKLIRFEEDSAKVDEAFEKTAKDFQKQASLPGFRPGKAPLERVAKQYEKEIEEETKRTLIGGCYREGIKSEKVNVVGYPEIDEIQLERGQPLYFTAKVETAPEFELPAYRGLPAQREKGIVTDADVERALDVLRGQKASFQKVDREVKEGDYVVVNYTGRCEGSLISELAPAAQGLTEKKNFWLEVKKDSFIPGFTEPLVGAKAGETRTVEIDFPPDFVTPELASKKGVYEVEVVEVKEKVLPELNDEFAQGFGADAVDTLRTGVRADLQNEFNLRQKRSVRGQLVKGLLDPLKFDLPASFVEVETRNLVYDIVSQNQKRGVARDVIEKEKDGIYSAAQQTAKERVKAMYVFSRIAEKEGIRVAAEELNARIVSMSQAHKISPKQLIEQLKKNDGLEEIQQQLLHEKVISFLQENARIEDVEPKKEEETKG